MLRLIQLIKREMRLNASAILFVSLSAVGADKLDEPKLLKSKAKKRLRTCKRETVRWAIKQGSGGFPQFQKNSTYDQVSDDDSGEEKWNAGNISYKHAVPHGFDPFSAQHSEHDHERVHEIREIPPWHVSIRKSVSVVCK